MFRDEIFGKVQSLEKTILQSLEKIKWRFSDEMKYTA